MDRGGSRARGDAAQPGRGQLGRAAVTVIGGPSPRGGRWMAACVRLRGPAGHGRCPCGQELRKGARGTLKSTPPIEQRTAGNGQKPTRGPSRRRLREAAGGRRAVGAGLRGPGREGAALGWARPGARRAQSGEERPPQWRAERPGFRPRRPPRPVRGSGFPGGAS